eukprot:gene3469-6900_t
MESKQIVSDNFNFRELRVYDKLALKSLHEELFPIKYSDSFYDDACCGKGLYGKELFTSIVTVNVDEKEVLAGFILAQFMSIQQCDDTGMFGICGEPKEVCYILTLGLQPSYRREGLGQRLIGQCCEYARGNPVCGAVYLHVIHYNRVAILFYEHMAFEFIKELKDFYALPEGRHSSYLYAFYMNGYSPPLGARLFNSISRMVVNGSSSISRCFSRGMVQSLYQALTSHNSINVIINNALPSSAATNTNKNNDNNNNNNIIIISSSRSPETRSPLEGRRNGNSSSHNNSQSHSHSQNTSSSSSSHPASSLSSSSSCSESVQMDCETGLKVL